MKWLMMILVLFVFSCTKVKVIDHQVGEAYVDVYVPVVKKIK